MNAVAPSASTSAVERSFMDNMSVIVEYLKGLPQTECPLIHRFAPGLYMREIFMPADTIIVGKIHKTEHFNVILRGSCVIVHMDGTREQITAPCTFISKPGVMKVLYILEDMIWQTLHPSNETDIPTLEAQLASTEFPDISEEARRECAAIAEERRQLQESHK